MRKIIELYYIVTHFINTSVKNTSVLNLYQNELLGNFPEVIKIWPALTVELLTGLYQCLFSDILSTLCMFTQNDQRIKLI